MIHHLGMWKFLPEAMGGSKEENLIRAKKELEELPAEIPFIRKIAVYFNENEEASQYDAVLVSEFDSMEDVRAYRDHPAHRKVAAFIKDVRESRACVDYFFDS